MPATLDITQGATDNPFADLVAPPANELALQPKPSDYGAFADLVQASDPAPQSSAAANELVGGGTADAPAFQKVGQNFSDVPRGVAVSTTDYGPFSDLIATEAMPQMDVTTRQFGPFDDLVPPAPAPETQKAVSEADQLHERQMADIERSPLEAFKKLFADFADTPLVNIPPEAVKVAAGAVLNLPTGLPSTPATEGLSQSGAQTLTSLTTPQNIALLASFGPLASAPAAARMAVSLGFSGYAAFQMGQEIAAAKDEKDPTKFFQHVGNAVTQGAFMTLAGLHGLTQVPRDTPSIQETSVRPVAAPEPAPATVTSEALAPQTETARVASVGAEKTISQPATGGGDITTETAVPQGAADLPENLPRAREAAPGAEASASGKPNPAAAIIPESGKIGFDILDHPDLGLQPAPDIISKIPSGTLPDGTIFKPIGEGYHGNRPAHYAFTPDGRVYSDSNRMMAHGGMSPWVLEYVTKWYDPKSVQEINPSRARAGGEPAPEVEPQFTPSAKVKSILEKQPVPEPGMVEPAPATEGGALFSAGGKRAPKAAPVGETPLGDKNWLRIPSWLKRAGRGLMTEGARGTLGRTKNQVGQALAKATRQHVDIEQELFGKHESILRKAIQSVPKERLDAAFTEASQFIRDKENGRTPAPLQADAQKILDSWYEVGRKTGDIARANNVQVFDRKTGAYRPMGTVKDYIPRMFSEKVEQVLRDPERDSGLFNKLAGDIAAQRGITPVEAAEELRGVSGRFAANDHMANLEMARSEALPESFYEYDLRNLASRYLPSFSERMAQIIAYGQRLGPREAPLKQNLWDVARREAQDTDTQQWLNDAEDQATGFHPKSTINRNVRRAQALGNATLLSDPTTTVMRNLLSGLTVTTERFGIGRSLRQLTEAGKSVSRMGAREIGVIRDDIGNFLGAEQLGDSKLDSFIREVQQKALKISGFTGSETLVRTHNTLTASAFARDAAAALATKPKSGLAREALAHFKRLDVDPEKIVSEKGNWKTGPETRKFIRSTVRESQGGYRFDQVPIWAGSSAGRFLYQYGRWAIQRSGDIFRNTIKPAIGESVEFRGQRMTRRNVMPLIRLGLGVVGLGETFGGIASVLFGRDRKDASFSEIGEAFSENEAEAVGLLGERIANDIIMAGTLGLLSQPIDFIKSTKDQSRFKNPAEPPSMAGIKALGALAQKAWDQGGTLTKNDWLVAAAAIFRGPKNVYDVSRHVTGNQLYKSQNDQRTLRNAARRWAKERGMDVSQAAFGDFRKSPNAPTFEAINDALLSGNAAKAQQVARDFVRSAADKEKAKKAVLSSVEGKSPFRAGPFTADKYRDAFLKWSKKNLSDDDQEQVLRVMRLYQKTARAAGLLD